MTTEPSTAKRRNRVRLWAGVAFVLVGLTLLGYVGWELYATNIISKRDQRQVTEQLTRLWDDGLGVEAEKIPPLRDQGTGSSEPGGQGQGGQSSGGSSTTDYFIGTPTALLRIPKFGSSYVVPVYQGTTEAILARGYGHFVETVGPGQVGNYALAAHRITHGEPLRRMPELRPGDQVIVETKGHIYTYVLDTNPNDLVVKFTDNWVIYPLPDNPKKGGPEPLQELGQSLITLTTCSELFHTDNRMVAFGHLVRSTAK